MLIENNFSFFIQIIHLELNYFLNKHTHIIQGVVLCAVNYNQDRNSKKRQFELGKEKATD
jgi:hypothetical protein